MLKERENERERKKERTETEKEKFCVYWKRFLRGGNVTLTACNEFGKERKMVCLGEGGRKREMGETFTRVERKSYVKKKVRKIGMERM